MNIILCNSVQCKFLASVVYMLHLTYYTVDVTNNSAQPGMFKCLKCLNVSLFYNTLYLYYVLAIVINFNTSECL